MAVNRVRNIAPFINIVFTVVSQWWVVRTNPVTGEVEIHRGLDIRTQGGHHEPIYSMLTGEVNETGYTSSAGNYIIIADTDPLSPTYGYATRYLHLHEPSTLAVGDPVVVGQQVGLEGETGHATGVHLHVEMQDISRFNWEWHASYTKSDYLDPTEFMGIDNVRLTQWIYDGSPAPPPQPVGGSTSHFKWVLYARKLRNARFLHK